MKKRETHSKLVRVIVSTMAPEAREVFVAGTFNDWNPSSHPLDGTQDGRWERTLHLPPGHYEYKFVIDGRWCCESGGDSPHDERPGCVSNAFGTMNRVLDVVEPMVVGNRPRTRT